MIPVGRSLFNTLVQVGDERALKINLTPQEKLRKTAGVKIPEIMTCYVQLIQQRVDLEKSLESSYEHVELTLPGKKAKRVKEIKAIDPNKVELKQTEVERKDICEEENISQIENCSRPNSMLSPVELQIKSPSPLRDKTCITEGTQMSPKSRTFCSDYCFQFPEPTKQIQTVQVSPLNNELLPWRR
ncbi:hypothetical protein Ciccas_000320 [Cichlidogyrus casuarinus]|uniref:Uncharacterized protein n=1 Tax=Cichlidogyrus casuarinus TaxID=1844966 RepID=A0ABD2QNJ1_9PLAT